MIADYELPKYMADNLEVRRYIILYQYHININSLKTSWINIIEDILVAKRFRAQLNL